MHVQVPLSPVQQCAVLQMALGEHYGGRLASVEADQIELQGEWGSGRSKRCNGEIKCML